MFFEGERIKAMREMILASDETGRRKALAKLLPMQRTDFEGIFAAMDGFGVTIRLLDPPLHEFVPHEENNQGEMAKKWAFPSRRSKTRLKSWSSSTHARSSRLPIGHHLSGDHRDAGARHHRSGLNVKAKGIKVHPEIMIPLIGTWQEFKLQEEIIRAVAEKIFAERKDRVDYLVGTMIEIPRAALTADEVAKYAEFFSFGTNDLTQMTFGYSRDDAGKFLPVYLEKNILKHDPFQILDQTGVGQLVELGTQRGRSTRPDLKVGICGEHGGEPTSVKFCHRVGMNYDSCSPYRVPIARLAAAQAALEDK
jgi:pyruvate,orthophosphate dikinase